MPRTLKRSGTIPKELTRCSFMHRWEDNLKRADKHAGVVEIPGAHHYMFLNEEGVVLPRIQTFLETLPN